MLKQGTLYAQTLESELELTTGPVTFETVVKEKVLLTEEELNTIMRMPYAELENTFRQIMLDTIQDKQFFKYEEMKENVKTILGGIGKRSREGINIQAIEHIKDVHLNSKTTSVKIQAIIDACDEYINELNS